MKLNTPASLKLAKDLIRAHGSWSKVRADSVRTSTGVFVVRPKDEAKLKALEGRLEQRKAG
jgi:hypothetical protein